MERSQRTRAVVLAACVSAFCIAMGLRAELNVWIGTGAAATLSILLISLGARPSSSDLLGARPLVGFSVGAAAGLAMSLATWGLYPFALEILQPIEAEVETLYSLLRQPPGPVQAFPLLLVVVAAEELVWRGLGIDVFAPALGEWRAVLMAALIYVLPQIAFRSPLLIVVALLCGLAWGALRVRTRGLIAPFVAHVVWDVLVFILYPVA